LRGALAKLNALGTDAVGISPDPTAAQKKFSDKLALNFPLLSGGDHAVVEAYGVWGEKSLYGKKYFGITRSSFLLDEKGVILKARYKISPDDTVPKVLAALGQGQEKPFRIPESPPLICPPTTDPGCGP
jgi:peroxiredoxin Q/BCP